jgi:hypothetical protein
MGWGDLEPRSGYRREAAPYGHGAATTAAICR